MEQPVCSATRQTSFQQFFIARSILKIIDLLSDSGSFLPWLMVKVKYQLNDTYILSCLRLINSIPLAWKTKIKHHFSDSLHICTDAMKSYTFLPDMSVKRVYRVLVNLQNILQEPKNLWSSI